jgi:hypothetical protein
MKTLTNHPGVAIIILDVILPYVCFALPEVIETVMLGWGLRRGGRKQKPRLPRKNKVLYISPLGGIRGARA